MATQNERGLYQWASEKSVIRVDKKGHHKDLTSESPELIEPALIEIPFEVHQDLVLQIIKALEWLASPETDAAKRVRDYVIRTSEQLE